MASFVYTNAYVSVNAVNLSDHVRSVKVTGTKADVPNTAMGSTYNTRLAGLGDFSVEVEWNQDHAASSVDATLWGIFNGGTAVAVEVRPDAGSVSATNPKWTGSVLLLEYAPISGAVGDLATTSTTFTGTGTLTRATS